MKICPRCSSENLNKNKFCNYCGAQLAGVEPEEGPEKEPVGIGGYVPPQNSSAVPGGSGGNVPAQDNVSQPVRQNNAGPNNNQPGQPYPQQGQQGFNQPGQPYPQQGQQGYYHQGQPYPQQGQQGYYPPGQPYPQQGQQGNYQQGQPYPQTGYFQPGGSNAYGQSGQGYGNYGGGNNGNVKFRTIPNNYTYSATPYDSKIPEIPITKYILWSIVVFIVIQLFGILGLVFTLRINKSETVEEQQKNLKYTKTCLIIGTVLEILFILYFMMG